MVDYRKILRSYMLLIAFEEGVTYVSALIRTDGGHIDSMTDEECEALRNVEDEVRVLAKGSLV